MLTVDGGPGKGSGPFSALHLEGRQGDAAMNLHQELRAAALVKQFAIEVGKAVTH